MSQLFTLPKSQAFNSSGDPVSGARLLFTENESSTPRSVYADSDLNTALANPVSADAYGVFPAIWLDTSAAYRVTLTDANGVTQWTVDDIGSAALDAATVGAALYAQSAAELAAGVTPTEYQYPPGDVRRYGAVGDASADDTAALQSAIGLAGAGGGPVHIPAGTYKITSALNINKSHVVIQGDGVDVTTIKNTGSGVAISWAGLGGASATLYGGLLQDFTIDGNLTGTVGLYMYDMAQARVLRVKSHRNTSHGIHSQMTVDCVWSQCIAITNGGDGFRMDEGTKATVAYQTNTANLHQCIAYNNTVAGLRVRRSRVCLVWGGDYATNAKGIVLEGGERCLIQGAWVENNTTYSLEIVQETTSPTFAGSDNKIRDNMITGTGTIQVSNGARNSFETNYIGHNMTIGASAQYTYVGLQATLVGTITDNGSGTINESNPASIYRKASGSLRFQQTIGSTVDFTSDIESFRFAQVKGISKTSTPANNLRGQATLSSGTAAVTFATEETNATYFLAVSTDANETIRWSSKATTGFTLTSSNGSSTAKVDWVLIR